MKSSTELIKATDDAVKRLVSRNIEEKGKPDSYAIGAMDGYIQGYCDGVIDNLNLDKACKWLYQVDFGIGMSKMELVDKFRKAMTE